MTFKKSIGERCLTPSDSEILASNLTVKNPRKCSKFLRNWCGRRRRWLRQRSPAWASHPCGSSNTPRCPSSSKPWHQNQNSVIDYCRISECGPRNGEGFAPLTGPHSTSMCLEFLGPGVYARFTARGRAQHYPSTHLLSIANTTARDGCGFRRIG